MRSSIFFCAGERPCVFPESCSKSHLGKRPTNLLDRGREFTWYDYERAGPCSRARRPPVVHGDRRDPRRAGDARDGRRGAHRGRRHPPAGPGGVRGRHHRLQAAARRQAHRRRDHGGAAGRVHRHDDARCRLGPRARSVALGQGLPLPRRTRPALAAHRHRRRGPAPAEARARPEGAHQEALARVRQAAEAREAARRRRQGAHQGAAGRLRSLEGGLAAGAARPGRGDRGQGSVHQGPLRPHRRLLDGARPRGAAVGGGPGGARVRRVLARHRQDRRQATRCCSSRARSTTTSGST